jgi:CheY-like chemotaxis protein
MLQREFSPLETVEVTDAETWVAALTAGGFDLVVTDYVMHWTDGLEVLKTLKARYAECPPTRSSMAS